LASAVPQFEQNLSSATSARQLGQIIYKPPVIDRRARTSQLGQRRRRPVQEREKRRSQPHFGSRGLPSRRRSQAARLLRYIPSRLRWRAARAWTYLVLECARLKDRCIVQKSSLAGLRLIPERYPIGIPA